MTVNFVKKIDTYALESPRRRIIAHGYGGWTVPFDAETWYNVIVDHEP